MAEEVQTSTTSTTETTPAFTFASDALILGAGGEEGVKATPITPPADSTQTQSSLPESTIPDSATATPATTASTATQAETPAPVEDELSFDIPDTETDTPSPLETSAEVQASQIEEETSNVEQKKLTSPLSPDAPKWQKEAFSRLEKDSEISDTDKELISKMNPSRWESLRNWNKSHTLMGKFRDDSVPMEQIVTTLEKQSKGRVAELELTIANSLTASDEKLNSFADRHPETYARLMVGLIKAQPEVLAQILGTQGYVMSKDEALGPDLEALKNEFTSDPDWEEIEGTPMEGKVTKMLDQLQKLQTLIKDQKAKESATPEDKKEDTASTPAQNIQQELTVKMFSTWKGELEAGIRAAGILPPSEEEMKTNPAAARQKKTAYLLAVNGLGQDIPPWYEQLFQWGQKQDDFPAKEKELTRLLKEGDEETVLSYSRSMDSDVYTLGRLRASIPWIKSLYRDAERLGRTESTATTEKVPETLGTSSGVGDTAAKTGFVSDALILGLMK